MNDMKMDELVKEINHLAHKKKETGLTEEELKRQKELRQLYLKKFREGFKSELDHIRVVDPNGNDVTPRRKHKKVH